MSTFTKLIVEQIGKASAELLARQQGERRSALHLRGAFPGQGA